MDAFHADVLIYAAAPGHHLGKAVADLILRGGGEPRIGSLALMPEVLARPMRQGDSDEVDALLHLLARLELRPLDEATADLSVVLGSTYGLRALDAMHLATAVHAGADRFITNNHRDFVAAQITEITVVHPDQLP